MNNPIKKWKETIYRLAGAIVVIMIFLGIVQGVSLGMPATMRMVFQVLVRSVGMMVLFVVMVEQYYHKDKRYLVVSPVVYFLLSDGWKFVSESNFSVGGSILIGTILIVQNLVIYGTLILFGLFLFEKVQDIASIKGLFLVGIIITVISLGLSSLEGGYYYSIIQLGILGYLVTLHTFISQFLTTNNGRLSNNASTHSSMDEKKRRLLEQAKKQKEQGEITEFEYMDCVLEIEELFQKKEE